MSFIKDLKVFVNNLIKKALADVHTNMPAQIVSYDATNNTCSIQPVIMRIRTNDPDITEPFQLPQIDDIPVHQQGSGKLLLSVAPQVGSYGAFHVSERSIENWIAEGGIQISSSSRKFHFSDGWFEPGLYPTKTDGDNGKLQGAIATDRISLRTRTGNTEISVLDDESILIKTTGKIRGENDNGFFELAANGQFNVNDNWTVEP